MAKEKENTEEKTAAEKAAPEANEPNQENVAGGMEELAVVTRDDEQMACLRRIEELARLQLVQSVKIRRASTLRTGAIVVMAVLFAVTIGLFYTFIQQLTVGVPDLIEHANELVVKAGDDLDDALATLDATINNIDFKGINEVIGGASEVLAGVGGINFKALNDSIEALAEGVENFRAFTDALSNPFGFGG